MAAENQQETSNEEEQQLKEEKVSVPAVAPDDIVDSHRLNSSWTLWFYRNDKTKNWEECQKVVGTFNSIEAFWRIHNHIVGPSKLPFGCDYSIFKNGIKPMWEDEKNRNGGRWLINYQRNSKAELDQSWLEVSLCLIGEAFDDDGEEICGAVVAIRNKGDKIGVWTSNSKNQSVVQNIGKIIKSRLNRHQPIGYQGHQEASTRASSRAKDMYTV